MNKIPILILTGFLGSGKTTLLNRLVAHYQGRTGRLAVLVNEFGKAGIDGQLLEEGEYDLRELNRGSLFCICVKKDFIRILDDVANIQSPPDLLLVEATGLADPGDLSAYLDEGPIAGRYQVAGNIATVDALQFHKVVETLPAVRNQVELASLLLLNKTDLVSPERAEEVRQMLRRINPTAPIQNTVYAEISSELLPDVGLGKELDAHWQNNVLSAKPLSTGPAASIEAVVIEADKPISRSQWESILKSLPGDLLRGKGIAELDDGRRYRIERNSDRWEFSLLGTAATAPSGRILLIGYNLKNKILPLADRFAKMQLKVV